MLSGHPGHEPLKHVGVFIQASISGGCNICLFLTKMSEKNFFVDGTLMMGRFVAYSLSHGDNIVCAGNYHRRYEKLDYFFELMAITHVHASLTHIFQALEPVS